MDDKLKKLWENAGKYFDVPEFDQFKLDMQDADKMVKLRESMSQYYEMPSIDQMYIDFDVKKKEVPIVSESKSDDGLLEPTESRFDYDSFIDKEEEEAIFDLQSKLTAKGYSVEETGIGDALLVTDNITGEQTEVDLQPFTKGGKIGEIEKVKKLIQTPADSRRALLSTNQLESYTSDKASYIENLKVQYPDFQFEYVQDPQKGGAIRITKGDSVGEFQVTKGTGDESKQFADINNFLYQNMTDEEASVLNSKRKVDEFKRIEEDIKNISTNIDVSMESAETGFYDKNYFKGLFNALEADGVSIPEDARRELEGGEKIGEYNAKLDKMMTVSFDREDIEAGIQKYFGSDPETMEKIRQYNLVGTIAVRKQKIDRAKKLNIENYYENRSDRDSVKEIVRQVQRDLTDQEADIFTNVEMAKGDLQKMISGINQEMQDLSERNPGVQFEVITNEDGVLQDIISSEPVRELDEVKNRIKNATIAYKTLAEKSIYELEKINSKSETVDQFMEAANRNYNLFDASMADLKNALTQLGGGMAIIQTLAEGVVEDIVGVPVGLSPTSALLPADVKMKMIRGEMAESREKVENFYKTKRTYDEAIEEGSKFEFGVRTFAEQAPNIALAIGTSGIGNTIGLSNAAVSTLVATQFGLTSAGQKYDELTTRQEFGEIAKKALKELESLKGIISEDEYLTQKYELERALEDSKISSTEKTLSVIGTGLVEGVVTRFIGTVPNSIKVLKDLKAPTKFMDDILRSNYKAAGKAFKEFGKRTGGEIIEETSIDLLTQINDYAFLGDQIDLSSLDDVAVTSIITSGAMNTPSTAYSTIMTQTNINRYKSKINSLTQEIGTLKDMLMDPDISNIQRTAIHNNISKLISGIADQTTNIEGDVLLMGAENIKEMLTLSGVRNSMLKKAGVENDDSYDVANVKIDNYLKGLDEASAKKFTDQMGYIDNRRNEITQAINYEGAVDRVFGEKGNEIAKDLDSTLTPQQKYVEVYKQIRQEINDNALKEFENAIQEQETGTVPDAKPAEGVQEVEEEVRVTPEEETEIEYTAPETVEQRRKENELLSAKEAEARGLERVKGQRWVVVNKVTGKLVYAPVKAEAQAIIDNMDYDYGEGDMVSKQELNEIRITEEVKSEVQKLRDLFASPEERSQVDNAEKALSAVAPDVEIVVHKDEDSYAEATGETGRKQKTAGTYNETVVDGKVKKTIHINATKANVRTVAHETFHAILLNSVKTNAEAQRITEAMMKAVAKVSSPELKAYLDNFASNYAENIRAEEKLAELVGKLASEYDSLPKPTQTVVKRWLDRLAKAFGLKPFTDTEVIDVLNTISRKIATGEAIVSEDVKAITEGASTFFSGPTTISRKQAAEEVQVSDTPANLSFVTSDDIIDIESLIDEIESKGQKVWFWVADQLGRGMYMDTQVGTEHFLDAGPSYALDPDNRSRNVIWATGKKESEVTRLIGDSDYIFIISGSPIKSKLFNKRVINILESRVGDYDAFKSGALDSNPTKPFRDILEKHDSWESLTESPDRKKLLNAIEDVKKKKGTPLKTFLQDNNAFIDIESLRDGFYAQNDFQMNDVMLVLKPTGFGGKSNHSTYENDILGEVVGVPNKRINAYDLMPGEVKAKYSEAMSEAQKAQVVAPYGIGVRDVSSRKQLSETDNATELVGVAKSQGISDAGIRQYAKENNIPLTLVNKAIAAYDAEKRIAGQRAEKMYTGEGNVVSNFLDRLRRKTLSSKGFMPKSMHVGKEVMEGAIAANAKQAEKTLKDLQRYLKKYKGNQNDLIESFDNYMRGYEVIENLPEDLQPIAYAMREHIDGLSKQLIDSGAVSNISFDDLTKAQQEQLIKDYGTEEDARANYRSLQENIMANLGSYMTRSYEVFDNKDYKPTEEVLLAAENKLREVYRKTAEKIAKKENNSVEDVLDRLVSKKIQDILTPEGANAFLTGSKLGSKKTGILRQRLDIPSEIRALMGEYTDPAVNYARSIQKMSALVANQQFLNKMKEAGEGVFFFNEPTGDYNVRIAAEGSSTMNPLNGMYTTKEIAEAMTNSGIVDIKDPLLKTAYNFWLKTVGLVKYNKTILSPATHAKNILGNVAFMAYNGYTNPKEYFKALDVIFTDLKSLPKSEQRAKMQEYIKAGIINQSVNLKEIQAIFESKDKIEDILTKRFNNPKNSPITKLNNLRKKIGKGFQSAYQAEDDFFKIVAYENEKSRYAKAFFNKGFNELTEDQKKEVTDYVSEIVKNILPNYSRIGELGKIMKAFPVAGTFISFQIEAMRTAYNTIDLAFNEMKDSKTRSIGVKRLAGIMSVIGLKAAMFGAFGLGDDEDETKEASRAFLPPWAKNSNTVITQLNDGKFKYINFSASDPHGFLDKAMIGYMRGESVGEGMMSVLDELVGPFYQSDILFNTLFNLKENRDDYGREIWNETDNANDMTEKIMSRLWKTFEPGGVTSIRKVVGSDVPFNELVGQLTGFKEWEVDAKNSSLFKAIDIKKRSSLASKDYSKAYYEMKDGKISQDELDQRYEEANLRYQDVMKDAIELYKSGLRLGISREDMIKQMAGSGRLSKDEILAIERGALPNKNRHLERKKKTSSGMKYSWE